LSQSREIVMRILSKLPIAIYFILLPVLVLVLPPGGHEATAAGPLVLAFYYAWYDMNTWASGQLSDLPQQPYVSADPATIDRHVSQARSAGIDGFVQSWYGPGGGNQTEANFQVLLNTASAYGFHAAADFETGSPFFATPEDRIAALQHLLSVHAAHPAYLRVDGRPVVFFWAPQLLSVDQWAAARAQIDPDRASIWIAEGAAIEYLSVFDGLHLYNIAWSDNPAGTLASWGGQVRAKATALGSRLYWVATAMPGWDDTRIAGRTGAFVRDRAGGDYYRSTWAGAIASAPDMIVVTSFNEWMEGSMIEPSATYGDLYLNLTGELAAAYKSGVIPAAVPAPQVSPSPSEPETESAALDATETATVTLTDEAAGLGYPDFWPTPRPDGTIVHIVESGDTLLGIANRYGVSVDELLALNGLERTTILTIGQNIVIAFLTPTPTLAPSDTPSPTRMPAIRTVPSVQPSQTPTPLSPPTDAPTTTPRGAQTVEPTISPSAAPSPADQNPAPGPEEVLPWPALTLGLLLVLAIWLLFRSPGSD
jgi:LysM repeat protein